MRGCRLEAFFNGAASAVAAELRPRDIQVTISRIADPDCQAGTCLLFVLGNTGCAVFHLCQFHRCLQHVLLMHTPGGVIVPRDIRNVRKCRHGLGVDTGQFLLFEHFKVLFTDGQQDL